MDRVAPVSRLLRRDQGDGWNLALGDSGLRIQVDYAVTFLTTDGFAFRIEQPFVLTDPSGHEQLLVPEGDPTKLAPVLLLSRTAVRRAAAFDDGRLELDFQDGSRVQVPCGEDYEPWEATGPEGLKLVAVPGGDLSIWR